LDKSITKRVFLTALVAFAILELGTIGYVLIEGWNSFDAFYMTVITLATIGFGEVHPLSTQGRVFTIFLVFVGLGSLTYAFSSIVAFVADGELRTILKRNKMKKTIEQLEDHYIICGLGQTGRSASLEFTNIGIDFVIVEKNLKTIEEVFPDGDALAIEGDATEDRILESAGVKKAKGLLATLQTDADNLFVVLTARDLNKNLRIVTRASSAESVRKMEKAGADGVICPEILGGLRMASLMLRPNVVSFLDVMMKSEDVELRIEEATITTGANIAGKMLRDIKLPQRIGMIVIAIKRGDTYLYNPQSTTLVEDGDTLIVLGAPEQMAMLRKLIVHGDVGLETSQI